MAGVIGGLTCFVCHFPVILVDPVAFEKLGLLPLLHRDSRLDNSKVVATVLHLSGF